MYEQYQNQSNWSTLILNKYPIAFFVTKYQAELESFVVKNYNKEAESKYQNLNNELYFQRFLQKIKINLSYSQYSIADEYKISGKETDFLTFLRLKHQSNYLLNQQKLNQKVYSQIASANKDEVERQKHKKQGIKKFISNITIPSNKSSSLSQLKKIYHEKQMKSISENLLSDVLIAQRIQTDLEAEHVIIRLFEGDNENEFVFSIEEYPVQNQSYQNIKKTNKKLTTFAISGLNSFNQKFNIFQNSLKYLKELVKEFDQNIQGRSTRNSQVLESLKLQISGMLQESVILKNRIFCIENYMNLFVKKNQIKLKHEQINIDSMLLLLNNFFPQVDIKKNYVDKVIQNDMDKIMYILISYISNAATCAKVMPIKMEVNNVNNYPIFQMAKAPLDRITNEIMQDNNSSNQYNSGIAVGGVVTFNNNQLQGTDDDKPSPHQMDELCQIKKNANNNQSIYQNKVFLSANLPSTAQNLNQPTASPTQIQSQLPSSNQLLNTINNINLQQQAGAFVVNNSREVMNQQNNQSFLPNPMQNPSNQFTSVRQNSFANDSNSYWDGIMFKISFYHERGEGLMDHFNCSEDKDSSKVEQKILKKFIQVVGPQQNIICQSKIQMKNEEEEEEEDDSLNLHDYEQFAFYQNHFKQFYQNKQNQLKKISSKTSFSGYNKPHSKSNYYNHQNEDDEENNFSNNNQTQDQYILSSFELIVFNNSDNINNPFFKTRNSFASMKTHFQNRINTDDMMTRIKASSSNFQVANLTNQKANLNNISNVLNMQNDLNQNQKNPTLNSNFTKNLTLGNSEFVQPILQALAQYETSQELDNISDELKQGEQHTVPASIFQRTLQFQTEHQNENQSHIQSFEVIPTKTNKDSKHEQLKQDSQQNILNCDIIDLVSKSKENSENVISNNSPLKTKSLQNFIGLSQKSVKD